MERQLEVIKIKSGDSYANINVSDFDPAKHEVFEPEQPKPDVKPKAAAAQQPQKGAK